MWRWVRFGSARIFVSIGIFASRHISKYPASYLGFPAHTFSITFSVHFLPLHCLSFPFSSSFRVLLGLSSAHLAFLFILFSWFCFTDSFLGNLGVCFSGFMLWVVFVLYLTSYMAGFGFWWVVMIVGRCASFFRSPFFISILSFHFSLHFYDKINEKRRGLYCVGEGLFRFDFWYSLLDCVIIGISFPRVRVLISCFIIGGGSFTRGFLWD